MPAEFNYVRDDADKGGKKTGAAGEGLATPRVGHGDGISRGDSPGTRVDTATSATTNPPPSAIREARAKQDEKTQETARPVLNLLSTARRLLRGEEVKPPFLKVGDKVDVKPGDSRLSSGANLFSAETAQICKVTKGADGKEVMKLLDSSSMLKNGQTLEPGDYKFSWPIIDSSGKVIATREVDYYHPETDPKNPDQLRPALLLLHGALPEALEKEFREAVPIEDEAKRDRFAVFRPYGQLIGGSRLWNVKGALRSPDEVLAIEKQFHHSEGDFMKGMMSTIQKFAPTIRKDKLVIGGHSQGAAAINQLVRQDWAKVFKKAALIAGTVQPGDRGNGMNITPGGVNEVWMFNPGLDGNVLPDTKAKGIEKLAAEQVANLKKLMAAGETIGVHTGLESLVLHDQSRTEQTLWWLAQLGTDKVKHYIAEDQTKQLKTAQHFTRPADSVTDPTKSKVDIMTVYTSDTNNNQAFILYSPQAGHPASGRGRMSHRGVDDAAILADIVMDRKFPVMIAQAEGKNPNKS